MLSAYTETSAHQHHICATYTHTGSRYASTFFASRSVARSRKRTRQKKMRTHAASAPATSTAIKVRCQAIHSRHNGRGWGLLCGAAVSWRSRARRSGGRRRRLRAAPSTLPLLAAPSTSALATPSHNPNIPLRTQPVDPRQDPRADPRCAHTERAGGCCCGLAAEIAYPPVHHHARQQHTVAPNNITTQYKQQQHLPPPIQKKRPHHPRARPRRRRRRDFCRAQRRALGGRRRALPALVGARLARRAAGRAPAAGDGPRQGAAARLLEAADVSGAQWQWCLG